ncbi:hypothetical protein PM082_014350 [Marasmius tenuissimus]|nr:hypothetical protein PM082_014350 [Marasmius tenuissimus]
MLTIDKLSAELLAEIFEPIHDSSRHTIFSLLRVSKYISDAALPFVYRELFFDFDQRRYLNSGEESSTRTLQKVDSLLELPPESAVWKGVRMITVRSRSVTWPGESPNARWSRNSNEPPFTPSEEAVQDRWSSFMEFLSRVINLRKLVFDCAERVPIVLLKLLEDKHPSCGLYVMNWTRLRSDARAGDTYEEALARSPCLRSIEARFVHGGPLRDFNSAAFNRILALSPNLEKFSLTSRAAGGCVIYGFTNEEMAEIEKERERFRVAKPLRKGSVKRIKWGTLFSSLLQRWEGFIDLRNVETLDLGALYDPEAMEYATDNGIFGGLKHLSLRVAWFPPNDGSEERFKLGLGNFLSSLPCLESLSIVNYHGYIDLPLVLHHCGKILRSLSLHQVENLERSRPTLTRDVMELIRSDAPHLENLEIDLNRTIDPESNESQIYGIITSFPNLRGLIIHYDLGIHSRYFQGRRDTEASDREFYRKVYTKPDRDFAAGVWQAVSQGNQLEKMSLYFGEPDREMGFGYPATWVLAEQEYRQQIHVSRNERDDLKDDIAALQIVHRGRGADLLPSDFDDL